MHTHANYSPLCLYRHLNLSQTVTLTVVTAGDALERAKLFHRYVAIADLLRTEKYANLFSFLGIMQGLAAPQVRIYVFHIHSQYPNKLCSIINTLAVN